MLRPRRGKKDSSENKKSDVNGENKDKRESKDLKSDFQRENKEVGSTSKKDQTSPQVWFNLIFFSILMLIVPLGMFYGTWNYTGNTTFAGIVAAVGANVVLISFVIVAFLEKD